MDAAKHKWIVFGAMGCAGLFVVGMVSLFLIGRNAVLHDTAGAALLRRDATADLQALEQAGFTDPAMDVDPADRLPHVDRALAELSHQACDTTLVPHQWIVFGDTFPEGSRQRKAWQDAARWNSVARVVAAAQDTSASGGWVPGTCPSIMFPWRLMIEGRAVLARAREQAKSGQPDVARRTLRAMVAIGAALSAGNRLPDAEAGLRLQRDALAMLATVSAARDTARLRREANGVAVIRILTTATLQRIARVSADPGHVDSLAELAASPHIPLVVRGEMVRMIGLGWVGNKSEQLGGVAPEREAALSRLAPRLPEELDARLQQAQRQARISMVFRVSTTDEFAVLRSMWDNAPTSATPDKR
jgi:hypothetical protein